ncbi:MAG TPA: HAMP domain-containing sensor histidine kinase [Chthoniobacteraceae bacterium]|nr:HAMP domain-containing sensor histidine kinase [Chthoniobacteraceae bacterium]
MRVRLPLSAKILLWFFLNFAALITVVIILFNAQFHFNLNWLLTGSVRSDVEKLRDVIAFDLENSSPDDWENVIAHHSAVSHLRLTVFDDSGTQILGPGTELPQEVAARLAPPRQPWPMGRPPSPSPSPTPASGLPAPFGSHMWSSADDKNWGTNANWTTVADATVSPSPSPSAQPGPPPGFERRGGPPFWWRGRVELMRTEHPTHYWLLVGMRIDNPETLVPVRGTLVIDDSSFTMGGLLVNLGPWWKLGLGAVAFTIVFWFPLLYGITRSIRKLNLATKRIAEGRFDARVTTRRRDELGVLAESINQMAARLDGFVKGQKRFLGDVAHELCSPLARLQMALGILEQNANEKQLPYAQAANDKAGQISTLVNALLDFSKASFEAQSVHLKPVNIKEVAEKALAQESAPTESVMVDIPANLTACADPELLTRAVANLVRNAVRHNDKVGKIILTGTRNGGEVTLGVADCGTGVPEAELPKIFDAFYRLDASRARETGGVGLGLTIVKTCVESCLGTVTARNRQPHGLEVIITLNEECPPAQK